MGIIAPSGRHHRCQIIHPLLRSVVLTMGRIFLLLQLLLLTLALINGIGIECRAKHLRLVFVCRTLAGTKMILMNGLVLW